MEQVYIAGVGMTYFGRQLDKTIKTMAAEAVQGALKDAGLEGQPAEAAFFANSAQGHMERQHMIRGEVVMRSMGVGGIPVVAFLLVAVFAAMAWLLHLHRGGRRIYAIGGDEKTARFAGVRVQRWIVLVYMASGLCAALAGLVFTARLTSVDAPMGSGYELIAIAIAVLGGTSLAGGHGSPYRTLCAALVFATGLNLLTLHNVNAWYQDLIIGLVLIAAVALIQWLQQRKRRSGSPT